MVRKKASDNDRFASDVYLTNSAREGWELILRTLEPGATILLPSYIGETKREGSGIYDPVSKLGVRHSFYQLHDDLSPNIDHLKSVLKSNNYSLVLFVHYFGFVIPNMEQIVDVCKSHDIIIVEDCAHLFSHHLSHISNAGNYGDYVFYSLHKFFPLSTGGLVVQNNRSLKPLEYKRIDVSVSLYKEVLRYDAAGIANKRRANFEVWDQVIDRINGIKKLKKMGPQDIPHNYPVVIENGRREQLYFWLMERNSPLIALYYRLIDPLQKPQYRSMLDLSDSILNLPVHQDTDREAINSLAMLLDDGINQVSVS